MTEELHEDGGGYLYAFNAFSKYAEEEAFFVAEWALGGSFRHQPARDASDEIPECWVLRYDLDGLIEAVFGASDARGSGRRPRRRWPGRLKGGRSSNRGAGGGVALSWEGLERLSFAPFATNDIWNFAVAWREALAAPAPAPPSRAQGQLAANRLVAMELMDLGLRMDAAVEEAQLLAAELELLWELWLAAKAAGFPGFEQRARTYSAQTQKWVDESLESKS
ncbi:hypothetical protein MNEG_2698 [Monoraphidium neglectum]|uniref:Uncharacterized protein n=1 Tax=Monoraphidium neglectum TaxID=145388 RepID=A0A0D2K4B3_9CHLO|nr:hypothetical protein MNEG_2698 [Monoraphidium neglectum]KIZ05263.1 hypothetical protein MNEG_2698 [Monoraphidium neglectum]|eukprot:XP_013904282.1 hypothetical protein MNEG_2698 [Monoraphidium neglectum]